MSPPTLAKVASGTALCWAQAARAAGLPGLADSLGGATIARPYSLAQQSYYASRAQLLVAQAEVASLDSAMGVWRAFLSPSPTRTFLMSEGWPMCRICACPTSEEEHGARWGFSAYARSPARCGRPRSRH
jgi:hypothetical protein